MRHACLAEHPSCLDIEKDKLGVSHQRIWAKVRDWLSRYGLAECVGITCALAGSFLVRRLTGSAVAAAYGGAWGETIGYSSVIIARDVASTAHSSRTRGRRLRVGDGIGVVKGLVIEFGPAGLLDTFVVRPFAMGVGQRFLGPVRGLIAGKLAADIVFYIPVIYTYERRKRSSARPPA
ncbi:MAG: hypothetical protein ABI442_00345 [Gemmatimonadaceae bacterium]